MSFKQDIVTRILLDRVHHDKVTVAECRAARAGLMRKTIAELQYQLKCEVGARKEREEMLAKTQQIVASCKHGGYLTHGRHGYPYADDMGTYCPTCNDIVTL